MNLGYDLTYELNDFEQPKLTSEVELVKNVIMYVLFSDKGQYPSLPMIGMNIEDYLYRTYEEIDTDAIKDDLIEQCSALGTYFDSGEIQVVKRYERGRPELFFRVSGKAVYPAGYISNMNPSSGFTIGVTYDEYKNLMLAVSE